MKYYIPVGPGGVLFRIGMVVTGLMGSLVYWRASRHRGAARAIDPSLREGQPPSRRRSGDRSFFTRGLS